MTAEDPVERDVTLVSSLLIGVLAFILFIVALKYRHGELALMTGLLMVLMLGTKCWSMASLRGLRCRVRSDKRSLFAGESLLLEVRLVNAKRLPVFVRLHRAHSLVFADTNADARSPFQQVRLLWHQQARIERRLTALKRGLYRLDRPIVEAGDIFGFFSREKPCGQVLWVTVYPRLVAVKPLRVCHRDLFGVPGAKSPVVDPVYLLGTRDYQPFRPARHIHWKASARRRRLQEKVFEPSEQGKIMLLLDVASFERHTAETDFERTVEAIGSLCVHYERQGVAIGFAADCPFPDQTALVLAPSRDRRQLGTVLKALARLELKTGNHLTHILQRTFGLRAAACLCFTLADHKGLAPLKALCARRHIPLTVVACRQGVEDVAHPLSNSKHTVLIKDLLMPAERLQ